MGVAIRDVLDATAHQALDRSDDVRRVERARGQRIEADLPALLVQVAHGGRQQHAAFAIGQAFGHATAHGGHERMGGAKVDTDRKAALVRIGRVAGF